MLTVTEATNTFVITVSSEYRNIKFLQAALLKAAVPSPPDDYVAALRLLTIMGGTDLFPLLALEMDKPQLSDITDEQFNSMSTVQSILETLSSYENNVRVAISEAKDFLPAPTIEILENYNTDGAPIDRLAVVVLIIMSANLQD